MGPHLHCQQGTNAPGKAMAGGSPGGMPNTRKVASLAALDILAWINQQHVVLRYEREMWDPPALAEAEEGEGMPVQ